MKKILSVLIATICLTVCAFSFTACGDTNEQTHTHNWSTAYTENGDRHYQTCDGCDEKKYSNHAYGTSGVCICGKQKPVETHNHNWSETYIEDGDRHYQACDGCDEKNYSDHNYGTSGVCVCGKQKPVTGVAVESVTLDKTKLTLEIGGTETLTASVLPDNATDKTVTYTVAPAGVVTVDEDGNVTAIKDGTATITATANGKTATCSVTVNAPLTNAQVLKYLNDNVLLKAAAGCYDDYGWETNNNNVVNGTWFITKDDRNITGAYLIFNYLRRADTTYITLCKIDFATPLTLQNITKNETVTATYTNIYSKGINPTIQSEHTALTNAICNKLYGDNATATRYIIDNGRTSVDTQFGKAISFIVIEIANTYIKETTIVMADADTETELLTNINNEKYYISTSSDSVKSYTITGDKLNDNNEPFFGNAD